MQTILRLGKWAAGGLVVALAVLLLLFAQNYEDPMSKPADGDKSTGNVVGNIPINGKHFVGLIPDGKTLTYDEFKKVAGDDVASVLAWAQPKNVTRKGNHIVIESTAPASTTTGDTTIAVEAKVEFDIDPAASDLSASNITGVQVTKGGKGPYPIKKASMSVDSKGVVTIKGSVLVSRFLPYWPFTQKVDAAGNPIP